jgi:integrase
VRGLTKDRDPRPIPILDPLLPVLEGWKLKSGGSGRVIPSLRSDGKKIDKSAPGASLRRVLRDLGLEREGLGRYEATRHTFASQWAMAGRPLRELQAILGHSSIAVTERYAHLAPGYWAPGVHSALAVDLAPGTESVADASERTIDRVQSTVTGL